MEGQKPVEEMTPIEMAGELNERREADMGIIHILQQNATMRQILMQMGVLIAFSPEEMAQIDANIRAQREQQEGGEFPHGI